MQGHLIVAHLLDGSIRKGTSLDIDPKKPSCHLQTGDGDLEIGLNEVKAFFFVKSHTGQRGYTEKPSPVQGDSRLVGTKRVRVRFADGEEIVGLLNRFPPIKPYFYMLPMDPESNNIRVLVNRAAVKAMEELAAPPG